MKELTNLLVYVLSMDEDPLDPTHLSKAKFFIKVIIEKYIQN